MKHKISLFTVALLLYSWSAIAVIPQQAQQPQEPQTTQTVLQKHIEEICSNENFVNSHIAVFAVNFQGDTLVNINSSKRLLPASNVKLITTGLALKYLGADFKYETALGYSGKIIDGVLNGDLYIIGGGDPTTGANIPIVSNVNLLFASWKKLIQEAGIQEIKGKIIADPRYFSYQNSEDMTWQLEDLGYYYGIGPRGLNFHENAQLFNITPATVQGQKPNISIYYPQTPWLTIINNARTGAKAVKNTLFYKNTNIAPVGEFTGVFPIDRKRYTYEASNQYASLTCAYYFYNYLTTNNISVSGYGELAPDETNCPQDSLVRIGSTFSPSLAQIVMETNHESDNFFAETLLRTMGRKLSATYAEDFGIKAEEALLNQYGFQTKNICKIADGSGLSRSNFISPEFFVSFLRFMAEDQTLYPLYLKSLPMPGSRGTLEFKFAKYSDDFKQRIRMKSGSMTGVVAYSGYILSSDADPTKTIAFSIICNNHTVKASALMPQIDSIIEILTTQN